MADSLADRLAELETSSTAELGARWEQAFKRSAPNRASRDLLDWDNTWKAFEAVRKIIGGQQALRDTRWCSKRALNRFTQSAQPDRHHDWPEVDQSMTEAEGRAFVLDLLEKLIASREKRAPQ